MAARGDAAAPHPPAAELGEGASGGGPAAAVRKAWQELVLANCRKRSRATAVGTGGGGGTGTGHGSTSASAPSVAAYAPSRRALLALLGRDLPKAQLAPGTPTRAEVDRCIGDLRAQHSVQHPAPASARRPPKRRGVGSASTGSVEDASRRPGKRHRRRMFRELSEASAGKTSLSNSGGAGDGDGDGTRAGAAAERSHNHSRSTAREERHNIFARWIATTLVAPPPPPRQEVASPTTDRDLDGSVGGDPAVRGDSTCEAPRRIVDVAGGKGHLSTALGELGFPCALVDPCAIDGRNLGSTGHFCGRSDRRGDPRSGAAGGRGEAGGDGGCACAHRVGAGTAQAGSAAVGASCSTEGSAAARRADGQVGSVGAARGQPPDVLVLRQTLEAVVAAEEQQHGRQGNPGVASPGIASDGSAVNSRGGGGGGEVGVPLLARALALVGLHPDEATEGIVDAALRLRRPFAVVPCCVLPQLFPARRLPGTGARVRKYGAFLEYLQAKDPRMRRATLPLEGRNEVLYMRAADFHETAEAASARQKARRRRGGPEFTACALAAKAGDLCKLQALRRPADGSAPAQWNTEVGGAYTFAASQQTDALSVCQCAAWAGHLHVLQFALSNGCPWSWSVVAAAASRGQHAHIVQWAMDQGGLRLQPAVARPNQSTGAAAVAGEATGTRTGQSTARRAAGWWAGDWVSVGQATRAAGAGTAASAAVGAAAAGVGAGAGVGVASSSSSSSSSSSAAAAAAAAARQQLAARPR